MQDPKVKYLKTPDGRYHLFYSDGGGIFCRHWEGSGWSLPVTAAENTAGLFALSLEQTYVFLLYAAKDGQLFLAYSRDCESWEHRPMKGRTEKAERTKFFFLSDETAFHFLFHMPTETMGVDALVYTAFREGRWEKPYEIDRFLPMERTPFLARRLSRGHIVLYYRTAKNVLGAREMLVRPYTIGSLTSLVRTASPLLDLSVVNDEERIHLLYVVRGLFRTQVVYQYKQTSAVSTPRILWEDAHCDNCLIFLERGRLTAMWTVNGQPMRCISETGGSSFGMAERYTGAFPASCTKGELLGARDEVLNAAEAYGDPKHGYLPAVYSMPAACAKQKQPAPDTAELYKAMQNSHRQEIEELSALLAQRSDEITEVNAKWKAQLEQMEAERNALRTENERLKRKTEQDSGE